MWFKAWSIPGFQQEKQHREDECVPRAFFAQIVSTSSIVNAGSFFGFFSKFNLRESSCGGVTEGNIKADGEAVWISGSLLACGTSPTPTLPIVVPILVSGEEPEPSVASLRFLWYQIWKTLQSPGSKLPSSSEFRDVRQTLQYAWQWYICPSWSWQATQTDESFQSNFIWAAVGQLHVDWNLLAKPEASF